MTNDSEMGHQQLPRMDDNHAEKVNNFFLETEVELVTSVVTGHL